VFTYNQIAAMSVDKEKWQQKVKASDLPL